jgi:hypothetical protein
MATRIKFYCRIGLLALAAGLLLVVAQDRTARPNPRGFDPQEMGRLESAMWRSYYDGRWLRLIGQTMQVSCGQYGFSWWDGARLSKHAAIAAMYFRRETNDPRCIGQLESYYGIVRHATRISFDVSEAARLELQWWQERRRDVPPAQYARTIARLSGFIHGVGEVEAMESALLRTQAMVYRDARRDGKMTDADWEEVSRQLTAAYTVLKNEVIRTP